MQTKELIKQITEGKADIKHINYMLDLGEVAIKFEFSVN